MKASFGSRLLWGCLVIVLASAFPAGAEVVIEPTAPAIPPPDPFELISARRSWDPVIDVVDACLPTELPEELAGIAAHVGVGNESARRRVLKLTEGFEREANGMTPQLHLWVTVIRAQAADTPVRREKAIRALDRALAWGGTGRARVCAYMERSRAELRNLRAPEASASALRVLRVGGDQIAPELKDAARFLRAEALRLSGRWEEALPFYQRLRKSGHVKIAAASALRVEDGTADGKDPVLAWQSLRPALENAVDSNVPILGFAHRAAERAYRAGDLRRALVWFSRAGDLIGDERTTGLAGIRKADVFVDSDRKDDALTTLSRLSEVHPDPEIRRLAKVRIIAHDLMEQTQADEAATLEAAAHSSEPAIGIYARALLLHRAVKAEEPDAALAHYAKLSYADPNETASPGYLDDLDAALKLAVDPHCPTTVRRLGGRRDLLMRSARISEPFLALADCFLALGMAQPALDTYRALSRTFGPDLAPMLTLRLARASLGVGDLASVTASVRAHRRAGGDGAPSSGGISGDSWPLFEAELALREGRKEAAAELLLEISKDRTAPNRAVAWLAELAREGLAPKRATRALEELIARWQVEGTPEDQSSHRAEIALVVADLLTARGDRDAAHYYYGLAADGLHSAAPRGRAEFQRAALTKGEAQRSEAFEASAAGETLWSRIAGVELRAERLRQATAMELPPVESAPDQEEADPTLEGALPEELEALPSEIDAFSAELDELSANLDDGALE